MNSYFVVLCLINMSTTIYICNKMKTKAKILFTCSLHLPVISSQNIYSCLIKNKCIDLEQIESFLKLFNKCYSDFINWIVKYSPYSDNIRETMKGYYYKAATYVFGCTDKEAPSRFYLTMAGWHLFLFIHKDKFTLNQKKYKTYLAELTSCLISKLTEHPELIKYIRREFIQLYKKGDTIESLVLLLINMLYDFKLNDLWYITKKIKIPVGCTFEKRAWFFDLVTRYFYSLIVLTDLSQEEIVIQHKDRFMWEYLFGYEFWWEAYASMVTLKVLKVISVHIYGRAQSQPLLPHGMPLPADLIVRDDGELFLNSSEIKLLNEFLV